MRKTFFVLGAVALAMTAFGGGCTGSVISVGKDDAGGGDSGGGRDSGGPVDSGGPLDGGGWGVCASDADCGPSGVCGFPIAAGCSATGTCFPSPGATCQAYEAGCACDGSEVNLICNGFPQGYAAKPVAHAGACDGGSSSECTLAGGQCIVGIWPDDAGYTCPPGYVPSSLSCAPAGGDCCVPGVKDGGSSDGSSFACGNMTCSADQYCTVHPPGIPTDAGSSNSYECDPIPGICALTPTCACIEPLVGPSCPMPTSCDDTGGGVVIQCTGL